MNKPVLYRQRLIPNECVKLKDDRILRYDEDVIVTSWQALHPKPDLHHGYSAYILKEGIKVSKFLKADGSLLYWYCDIVDYRPGTDTDTGQPALTVIDLLADVIVYPDGFVKLVDLDELVEAARHMFITNEKLQDVLLRANGLLTAIYEGHFPKYQEFIEHESLT